MIHIGAGGWGYFNVPGIDPLSAYAKAFDFVFSVKCHKDLTHKYLLSACEKSLDLLTNSLHICRELKANILLMQTPHTFDPDEKQREIKDLFLALTSEMSNFPGRYAGKNQIKRLN